MATPIPTRRSHPGRWWQALPDGRFECALCPRRCRLAPGQRGFCYVREATDDGVVLTAYGRAVGLWVDPIEKKPLNHFLPGSAVLSFGTVGCNLGCRYCQNWDMSKAREMDLLAVHASPEDIARVAVSHECESVAFTYNDPIPFAEYALDTAQACHERGLRTVAVTNGYVDGAAREAFFAGMDAANVDLKAFTEDFYRKLCLATLQPVLDTLEYVAHETQTWLEVTTLLIPGYNDSDQELDQLTAWLHEHLGPSVPLHLTAFHPAYKLLDVAPTPAATLVRAYGIARRNGLEYVYAGNVRDVARNSTWCPQCDAMLIERVGYHVGEWALHDGACGACGHRVPGVFAEAPGAWRGHRPMRLSLAESPQGPHGAAA